MSIRSKYAGVAAILVVVGSGFAAMIAARSFQRETNEFFPPRHPVTVSTADAGLAEAHAVVFQDTLRASLHGWYIPSRTGAAAVLLHGAGGDRSSLAPEARALASKGIGVLLFDLPGHGESEGEIHWNEGEERALQAAIEFLQSQPDVDPRRIGGLGFSLGGAVLARVAAADARLSALVFAGTPSDQVEQVELEYGQWGPLSQLPALSALRRRGMLVDRDQPRDVIGAIAPRPILIVSGTVDDTVPLSLGQELFAAARDPKELLEVNGAGHGGYEDAPGSTYLDDVAAFFESHL